MARPHGIFTRFPILPTNWGTQTLSNTKNFSNDADGITRLRGCQILIAAAPADRELYTADLDFDYVHNFAADLANVRLIV